MKIRLPIEQKQPILHYNRAMKITAKINLRADAQGKKRLLVTMEAFNAACNDIAAVCFQRKTANKYLVQKLIYHDIRHKHRLSAQLTVRAIAKTCEAYKRDKSIKPEFRKHGGVTYDARILTFKGLRTETPQVSMTTLDGRGIYDLSIREHFAERIDHLCGQVDMIYRDGDFFLLATCDMPEGDPVEANDILGVDLGVVNIATDNTGEVFSNEKVEKARVRIHRHRGNLQKKNTKSAKRRLKKVSGKVARFRADTSHCISKHIVEKAKDNRCVIGLEDLTHINSETRCRKSQRAERLSWAFSQLRSFIVYKAKLSGVSVVFVEARNTSRQCSRCGHIDKANRRSQSQFQCVRCDHRENADVNAAKNIRSRAASTSLLSSAASLSKVG